MRRGHAVLGGRDGDRRSGGRGRRGGFVSGPFPVLLQEELGRAAGGDIVGVGVAETAVALKKSSAFICYILVVRHLSSFVFLSSFPWSSTNFASSSIAHG